MSSYTCVKGAICFTICLCIPDLDGNGAPKMNIDPAGPTLVPQDDDEVYEASYPNKSKLFHDMFVH